MPEINDHEPIATDPSLFREELGLDWNFRQLGIEMLKTDGPNRQSIAKDHLPSVTDEGKLEITPIWEDEGLATETNLVTLATYSDGGTEHSVKLCSVGIRESDGDINGYTRPTVFIVDQTKTPDGRFKLGAIPGVLSLDLEQPGGFELSLEIPTDTSLNKALFSSFASSEELFEFLRLKISGNETSPKANDRLIEALRAREPEEVEINRAHRALTVDWWMEECNVQTLANVEAAAETREQRRQEQWARKSGIGRLLATVEWHLVDRDNRPPDIRDL